LQFAGKIMNPFIRLAILGALAILAPLVAAAPGAAQQDRDPRLALVIGESSYQQGPLATAANDAGLVANTLSEAGFEVIGARDLDQDALRRSLREFLDKAAAAGPNATVFVYFAGYGLQLEGENFLVPIGARIARDTEVPIEALRLSDFSRSLAAIPMKARILVLDGAHAGPFAKSGPPLASGLALMDPEAGTLIAFNAAPGTVAAPETGPYGVFAQALTEMMRDGGLPLSDVFARTRLRVTEQTRGALVPWEADKIEQPFSFFNRAADAPPPVSAEQTAALKDRPIRELKPEEAYGIAVERDTLAAYEEFLAAFPNSPLSKRVHAMLAARREAVTWRRTVSANAPNAYWSYLKRYPNGPHAADARRRLTRLTAPLVPPPVFDPFDYDVPPPPPEEYGIVDRPVLVFDEPDFGPPPVVPVYLLPPPPDDWVALPPPPPPPAPFYLPIPVPIPIPVWSRPPHPPIAPPPPVVAQPGTGRPLLPPTVPVGAGFIQPPQAIITRPPATTRPAALPGQPGSPIPTSLPTTQLPTTQPAPTTAPASGAVAPQNLKPGQLPQPLKPGQTATQPNAVQNPPPGTQPLVAPGANGLPAAGGTTPPSKPGRGHKSGTPGTPGAPVDQNAVAQPPATGGAAAVAPGGQTPTKGNVGAGNPTAQQLRQQQLLQQKQQIDEQKAQQAHQQLQQQQNNQRQLQQQQLRQPQLEQQKVQQQQLQQQKAQQILQQKNLQQQQQLEEKKSQQQQLHQQQIQQQQMQRQEMQRQQQSQQQQIRLQQQQGVQRQQPLPQQRAQPQQQIGQQQVQQQVPARQPTAHPNCGRPGLPACPR
jgi:uncharacterized caspase-like protein